MCQNLSLYNIEISNYQIDIMPNYSKQILECSIILYIFKIVHLF